MKAMSLNEIMVDEVFLVDAIISNVEIIGSHIITLSFVLIQDLLCTSAPCCAHQHPTLAAWVIALMLLLLL